VQRSAACTPGLPFSRTMLPSLTSMSLSLQVCEVPQLPLKGLKQAGLGDGNSNLQAQLLAVRSD